MSRIGPLRSQAKALAASALAVATVTAGIAVVDDWLPVFSLIVLYILAVLAVALFYGTIWASLTALASMLAFNYFFLPPVHTLRLADRSQWIALGVFVVTAVVVGTSLGDRSAGLQRPSNESGRQPDRRRRESELLRGTELAQELDRVAGRAAETLGLSSARLDLGGDSLASGLSRPTRSRRVGRRWGRSTRRPTRSRRLRADAGCRRLGALLAVAEEREELAR